MLIANLIGTPSLAKGIIYCNARDERLHSLIYHGPLREAVPDQSRVASILEQDLKQPIPVCTHQKGDPMQLQHKPNLNALFRHVSRAEDFVSWLRDEGDALVRAADLLGGHLWAKKAQEIVLTARKWRFACVHPDDPEATCAMLCSEALDRGIRAFEALRLAGITNITEVM